jgi:hypothetical protein
MALEFTLEPEDVASARMLAVGIRPRLEFSLFTTVLIALLAGSVSPWSFGSLPLLIGLTASLGAFRLIQIGRIKEAAMAAYQRNPTLRRQICASWDQNCVTIQPAGGALERIPWAGLRLKENGRIVLLAQPCGMIHAIPKRAFAGKASLADFKRLARRPGN